MAIPGRPSPDQGNFADIPISPGPGQQGNPGSILSRRPENPSGAAGAGSVPASPAGGSGRIRDDPDPAAPSGSLGPTRPGRIRLPLPTSRDEAGSTRIRLPHPTRRGGIRADPDPVAPAGPPGAAGPRRPRVGSIGAMKVDNGAVNGLPFSAFPGQNRVRREALASTVIP